MGPKNILGISCFSQDSAACLVRDGEVIAAVEEERLSRRKHDPRFPTAAIQSVLQSAGVTGADLDEVVFYENPDNKIKRLLAQHQDASSYKAAIDSLAPLLRETCGYGGAVKMCERHVSLASCAFYNSPFEEAAILIVDGAGEEATTSLYHGKGTTLAPVLSVGYPHSLGLFYAALTTHLGFEANEGEYKVMGLAAYGQPTKRDQMRKLMALHEDGTFALDLSYFAFGQEDEALFTPKLVTLLGPPRTPNAEIETRHADIASSLQAVMEEALLHLARAAYKLTGCKNLCLGGGVAHNIVANAKLRNAQIFEALYIHFASGDSGGAIGAALYGFYERNLMPRVTAKPTPYLGPAYDEAQIENALAQHGLAFEKLERDSLLARVAQYLKDDLVIGWHQGRLEFGPRALGHRSILASATNPKMKDILNSRVKRREEFRPFAPAVLCEKAKAYFDLCDESPTMLYAAGVHPDKQALIPAVTHVDGTARPQTIRREEDELFYDLIAAYERLTGLPVIINTSFNVRGEPIVCSPDDALHCFNGTGIDALIIGSYIVQKQRA